MGKKKSLFLTIFIILITIILIIIGTYYSFFYPKHQVKSLNSDINIDNNTIVQKFLPNEFKFSFKDIYVQSDTNFNENELTDLFISAINKNPSIKNYINGVKVNFSNEDLNLYTNAVYKNIPVQARFIFTPESKNGKALFHYKEGKIGLIPIGKDFLFYNLQKSSIPFITLDKDNADIIISLKDIKQLHIDVKNLKIEDNNLHLSFIGKIKLYEK